MAAKIGPAGPILAAKVVRGPLLTGFFAKLGLAGLILRGTDFGVTGSLGCTNQSWRGVKLLTMSVSTHPVGCVLVLF